MARRIDKARYEMLVRGNFARAEQILLDILKTSPEAPTTTFLTGTAALYQGRYEDARRMISSVYENRRWVNDRIPAPMTIETLRDAARVLPDWDWPRYQLARERWRAIGLTIESAVRHLAQVQGGVPTFVQVGANDGKSGDPLHKVIRRGSLRGLLVEPQPEPFDRLQKNYSGVPGLQFENSAVAEVEGPIEMVTATDRTTIGSTTPDRTILHLHQGEIRKVTVTGRPFPAILARHGIERFDLLQIDTEGFDYQVLRQVDLARRGVQIVNMEYFCLPIAERIAACEQLDAAGFAVFFSRRDLLAVRRETFTEAFCITDLT